MGVFQVVHPELPSEFGPVVTGVELVGNLPAESGRLVGRSTELTTIAARLRTHPIVTLRGAGGGGKTRLALAYAHRNQPEHPGGVWFVDLVPAHDVVHVWRGLAEALGAADTAPADMSHWRAGSKLGSSISLVMYGAYAAERGTLDVAATLLGTADETRRRLDMRIPVVGTEALRRRLTGAIDGDRMEALGAQGVAMDATTANQLVKRTLL
jgi:hypothetical protein